MTETTRAITNLLRALSLPIRGKPQDPFTMQMASTFFKLPRELRDEIYDYLLADMRIENVDVNQISFTAGSFGGLRLTCKQIRMELTEATCHHTRTAVKELLDSTLLYPFSKKQWAKDFIDGHCRVCASQTHRNLAVKHQKPRMVHTKPTTDQLSPSSSISGTREEPALLLITVKPCKCHVTSMSPKRPVFVPPPPASTCPCVYKLRNGIASCPPALRTDCGLAATHHSVLVYLERGQGQRQHRRADREIVDGFNSVACLQTIDGSVEENKKNVSSWADDADIG